MSTSANALRLSLDDSRAFGWILLLAVVLLLAGLGLRDPWPADEPRFAQIAREMVQSGQWLFPTRGGELYSEKPPLFMWTVASLYTLTGNLRVAFLLPSALSALLCLVLVHDLARRWWSRSVANTAALLLLASLQFVLQGKTAQIDMMVTLWTTLGAYGLLRHLVPAPRSVFHQAPSDASVVQRDFPYGHIGWYVIGWFSMGLGVITKGVGFLPVFLLLPWAALVMGKRSQQILKPGWSLLAGVPFFALAIALWLVPMVLAVDAANNPAWTAYRDDILFRQTGERYANSWAHLAPWYYFIVSVIPMLWLPMSLMLPWLVKHWWHAIKQADARIVLPVIWILCVVVFFSATPGKRGVYILPALPLMALAAAPFAGQIVDRRGFILALRVILGLFALVLLLVGVAGLAGVEALAEAAAKNAIEPWWLVLALGIAASVATFLCRPGRALIAWFSFIVPLWLLYSTWGYTLANDARTPASVYRMINEVIGSESGLEIGLVDFREQYLLFAPWPVTHFGYATPIEDELREAWRWLGEQPGRYLLLADRFSLDCYVPEHAIPLVRAHSRDWRLYGPDARARECQAPESDVTRYRYEQGGALPIGRE